MLYYGCIDLFCCLLSLMRVKKAGQLRFQLFVWNHKQAHSLLHSLQKLLVLGGPWSEMLLCELHSFAGVTRLVARSAEFNKLQLQKQEV